MEANHKGNVAEVFSAFLKLGLTSFGGPIAHIGYFRKEFIEKRQWVNEEQFSQLLAICQFLPGPASSQLGFSLGLMRAGWFGAIMAFLAFTLPSAFLLIIFASALPLMANATGIAIIHGLKLVAVAVVSDAVFAMSKKLCPDHARRIIAILAATILLTTSAAWSQIFIILLGAIAGVLFCHRSASTIQNRLKVRYSKQLALVLFVIFISILLVMLLLSGQSGLLGIGQAFYKAGALVFGGGHVVLPLLKSTIVDTGLVSNENFLAGYGASQAIPGPMFAFSAYLGAITPSAEHIHWLGAFVALTFMFLPGFLLVAAALPIWQFISSHPKVSYAIAGINAAVVGILAATLYNPIITSSVASYYDLTICAVAIALLVVWRLSPLFIVAWCLIASVLPVLLS